MKKIIIDAGFGDSGKGIVTDWLCSSASKPALVVRHSGGHQCGHTVVDGKFRHVFSNFGSGSFRGVPTWWSRFCTVEPRGFMNELEILTAKGVDPEIYIDARCPVTTPYDIVANQHRHRLTYHGSCGVGFGATMQREEDFYSLVFCDLYFPDILQEKLRNIRNYYRVQGVDVDSVCEENFLASCADMVNASNIKKEHPSRIQDYIFEGSQGLLLDQHFGFFPHVTRSNTGTKNALDLLTRDFNQFYCLDEIYLVTRAYQTRHGAGWMSNQHITHKILENPNETNKDHKYQGTFRRTLLDVTLLEYAINRDKCIQDSDNKRLVLTCLDHIVDDGYRFTYRGELITSSCENEFVGKISEILEIKDVFLSHSEDSKNITQWKNK